MALRVLLADESTTIKKVMQLALQDFAVDVKSVQSGLDVAEVARSFQPEIIFADVLLPKRNGYDVTAELKSDSALSKIPVVLMWSSFMDLDETAYARSRANSRLEKPFDVETLRTIVKELVPKTQSQRLAHFLKFPADFVEPLQKEEATKKSNPPPMQPSQPSAAQPPQPMPPPLKQQAPPPPAPPMAAGGAGASSWNMESFDPLPDLEVTFNPTIDVGGLEDDEGPIKMTRLTNPKAPAAFDTHETDQASDQTNDPWSHQNLSRFKLDIPTDDVERDEISIIFDMNDLDKGEEPKTDEFLLKRGEEISRVTARVQLPKEEPPPLISEDTDDVSAFTQRFEPIGEVPHGDAVISQFSDADVQDTGALSLEENPNELEAPVFASLHEYSDPTHLPNMEPDVSPSQMTASEIERVIRAQSRDVIEEVVRRVVPELAKEIIKAELERLLSDENVPAGTVKRGPPASAPPKGKRK